MLGVLPARFPAFQWHYYAFDVPAGRRRAGAQPGLPAGVPAGREAWAVQFHPEVTREIVAGWAAEAPDEVPGGADALLAETEQRIDEWMRLGRGLCGAFLDTAEGFY